MSEPSKAPRASVAPFGAAYFATFGALGVYAPFLALYLRARGLDDGATASLLAWLPLVRTVTAPAWTVLADVLGSSRAVLRLVAVFALVAFAALLVDPPIALVVAALVAFNAFRSPASALVDALALAWTTRAGRAFGPVRALGTAGYTLSAFATGLLVSRFGARAVVVTTVAFLALTVLSTFVLPTESRASSASRASRADVVGGLRVLARRPRLVVLALTAALHQVGLASYDALFPAYLTSLSSATYAGVAVALGACAEVALMASSGRFLRAGPGGNLSRVLAASYAVSAVRWLALATLTSPVALVAVQALHAVSFGAFYLAAVARVHEEAPESVRASAQGTFNALTWGVATSFGLGLAGFLVPRVGLRGVFAVATVASLLACALSLVLERAFARNAPDAPA